MSSLQKIYVAGHRGMVGSAIVGQLLSQGVAPGDIVTRTHAELDLTSNCEFSKTGEFMGWCRTRGRKIADCNCANEVSSAYLS